MQIYLMTKIIPNFIKELKDYPFVIGSRYIKGGRNETKLMRYLLSIIGNKIIKFVLNINCENSQLHIELLT